MHTPNNAASVQQSRHARRASAASQRDTERKIGRAEAELRKTLGFTPTVAEVSNLIETALDRGMIDPSQVDKARGAMDATRAGTLPPEVAYLALVQASADAVADGEMDTLAAIHAPDDALEIRLLDPSGDPTKARALSGRLGVPKERDRLRGYLKAHHGQRNAYVGIDPRSLDMAGTGKMGNAGDVAARKFVVLDLDHKEAPDTDPGWSRTVEHLSSLGPMMTARSGNGWHVWFRIEPQTGADIAGTAAPLAAAMAAIGADNMARVSGIIRVPGSLNIPTPGKRERGNVLCWSGVTQGPDTSARTWPVEQLCKALRNAAAELSLPGKVKTAATTTSADIAGTATGEKAPRPAPGIEALRMVLDRLPNEPGGPFDDRDAWQGMGHAVKGSAIAGGLDMTEARAMFLDWSLRNGGDADEPERFWDTCNNPHSGWGYVMRTLERVNPTGYAEVQGALAKAAFEASPVDPAQAEQLKSIPAAIEPGVPDWVSEVNQRYAYLESADRILDINPDTGQVDKYLTPEQFKTRLGNQMIASGTRSVALGQAWLTHPQRRQYTKIEWCPVGREPKGALNLWRGFPAATALADDPEWRPLPFAPTDPLKPTLDFIETTIAGGRKDLAEHILNYAAFKAQNPTARPGTVIALVGASGTGKTTLGTMLADLFGPQHSRSISKPEQVLGRFNSALEGTMVLNLEEALFGGDKRIRGLYKDLITSPVINIERKGLDIGAPVPNMAAIIITSNDPNAIPHEPGERRTTFIKVSDVHRQNAAYFAALHGNWTSGGREAFLDFLLKRDVSRFNPRQAFDTPEKAEAAGENGDLPVQFWAELLDSGKAMMLNPDGSEPNWNDGPLTVPDSLLYGAFKDFAKDRGAQLRYLETKAALMRRLEELCPGMRATQPRPTPNRPGVRSRAFPPLGECRTAFNTAMGGGN